MKHGLMKHKILCFSLSLALSFETLPLPATAANAVDIAADITASAPAEYVQASTLDGQDMSLVGSTDSLDVSGSDIKTPKVVASGTYKGIIWTIDNTGFLLVSGTYDQDMPDQQDPWWKSYYYRSIIKSAKIEAKNITDTSDWFCDSRDMTSIDLSTFDTSKVTNMCSMFEGCRSLTSLDVSSFDTSNVTDMSFMFYGCSSLTSLDVSSFDTSKVTRMRSMFDGCRGLASLDVSSFDTAKLKDISSMFAYTQISVLDMSNMDLSSLYSSQANVFEGTTTLDVIKTPLHLKKQIGLPLYDYIGSDKNKYVDEDGNLYTTLPLDMDTSLTLKPPTTLVEGTYHGMAWTFYKYRGNCTLTVSGTYDPNAPEGEDWHQYASEIKEIVVNADNVESMAGWFKDYKNLKSVDLSGLGTSKITDISYLFDGCDNLQTVNLSGLDTSNVTDMSFMFYNCGSLQTLDASGLDTTNVTNMSNMFYRCTKLEGLDLHSFNTSKVTDMSNMFAGCHALSALDISSFNTAQVTDMSYMFSSCYKLKKLDLSHFDTTALTTTKGMFYNDRFSNLKLGNWDNPNLTDISYMFSEYQGSYIDLTGFHTPQVKTMSHMFDNCKHSGRLDLSGFDTAQVTDMSYLFYYCSAYGVDLHSFNTANVTDMSRMFYYCSINTLDLQSFDTSKITDMSYLFYNCHAQKIYLQSFDTSHVTDMSYMFASCSCPELDLSHFDTSNVLSIEGMFKNANLQSLDLSAFDLAKAGNAREAFYGCLWLRTLRTPRNVRATIDLYYGMTNIDGNCYYALPADLEESIEIAISSRSVTPIEDQLYTGSAVKPKVHVFIGLHELIQGQDYKVTYINNVHAASANSEKAPTALIKGIGHYSGTITVPFTILPAELTEDEAILSPSVYMANGSVQKTVPTITVQKKKLVIDRDFTVEFPDTAEGAYCLPGTYPMVIHGKGDYHGTINTTLTLLAQDQIPITQLKIAKLPAVTFVDGVPATPSPKITYQKRVLTEGVDYALSYKNNDKAGTATLIVTGLQNTNGRHICGSITKRFLIKGLPLNKAAIQYDTTATFTGKEICPAVTVSYQGKRLLAGEDYSISYEKNVNVGTAKITLTGCGNYSGTVNKTFRITPLTASTDTVMVRLAKGVAYYEQSGAQPALTITCGDNVLKEKTDYTVKYTNNRQIASADAPEHPTAIITGKGNYRFQIELPFSIEAKSLSDRDITVYAPDVFPRNRKYSLSKPIVKDGRGKTLKAGRDYKILGYANLTEDMYTTYGGYDKIVVIQGIGNYTGEAKACYSEAECNISRVRVHTDGIEFSGNVMNLTKQTLHSAMKLYDSAYQTELGLSDYAIVDYKYNAKSGNVTVTIRGCSPYGGQKKVTLKCIKNDIS